MSGYGVGYRVGFRGVCYYFVDYNIDFLLKHKVAIKCENVVLNEKKKKHIIIYII